MSEAVATKILECMQLISKVIKCPAVAITLIVVTTPVNSASYNKIKK